MNKTKNILIIILILALLVGALVFFVQRDVNQGPIIEEENGTTSSPAENEDQEDLNFSETGNIIINNPGFEEDTYYLSYEKPGQMALSRKLIFNQDSICIEEEEKKCNEIIPEDNLESWSGKRVKVEGLEEENQVTVQTLEFLENQQLNTEEQRIQVAKDWIVNNSPTYNYDGQELLFVEERGLDLVDCENCYELEFEFTSTHGGYGDRTGKAVIQVITPHTIVVLIKDGEIERVITDGKFNEMTEEMI